MEEILYRGITAEPGIHTDLLLDHEELYLI